VRLKYCCSRTIALDEEKPKLRGRVNIKTKRTFVFEGRQLDRISSPPLPVPLIVAIPILDQRRAMANCQAVLSINLPPQS
jgi:hypothetical protein